MNISQTEEQQAEHLAELKSLTKSWAVSSLACLGVVTVVALIRLAI